MPSTVIRRFVYDQSAHALWVEFVSGRRYVYSDVPEEVAETFRLAFSKGIYFNTRIRDRFPCREVTHEHEATES
jgi:lysyl-tRNA synthetase class 2